MIIEKPELDGGTILLLEDEAFIGMAIREFLSAAGAAEVVHAFTVKDALDHLKNYNFDAAILDVRLPEGSCYDVAVALAKLEVALVFHSGHVQVDFLKSFPNAVFCGKPAGPAKLIDALSQAKRNIVSA